MHRGRWLPPIGVRKFISAQKIVRPLPYLRGVVTNVIVMDDS